MRGKFSSSNIQKIVDELKALKEKNEMIYLSKLAGKIKMTRTLLQYYVWGFSGRGGYLKDRVDFILDGRNKKIILKDNYEQTLQHNPFSQSIQATKTDADNISIRTNSRAGSPKLPASSDLKSN